MMHLLLGVKKRSDGVRMLQLILSRYGLYSDYRVEFCYDEPPPSRVVERAEMVKLRRQELEAIWLEQPGVIIGFGWVACEMLTGRGKTKLKKTVGTKWTYVGSIARSAWITYDPDACLFDPAIIVDISAVIVQAGKEEGFLMQVYKNQALNAMQEIWKRYL